MFQYKLNQKMGMTFCEEMSCPYFLLQRNGRKSHISAEFNEVLIASASVKNAVIGDLNNAVRNSFNYLIIVRCEENISLKVRKTVIYGSYGFKVEMVGRVIEHKHVRAEKQRELLKQLQNELTGNSSRISEEKKGFFGKKKK